MKEYSNLSKVIFRRTYARRDHGHLESRSEAIKRIIEGNIGPYKGTAMLLPNEAERLDYFMSEGKCGPAGRGWWFSGSPVHAKRGAIALNNCFHVVADHWRAYPIAADMLMCGGGVGMSVEHRYVSKLPTVKRDVSVIHQNTKDADFIVPDSREGWCKLLYKLLEAFFETGKSFSYSTVCIRGYGEPLKGFGGLSAGPMPLIAFVEKASALLKSREGKKMRPIDAADMLCAIGEMVVAGNIRRSALLIQGDCFDKEFLKAKRWDLGSIPTYRAMANFSVVCDDVDDLHPLFWKTYEHGEPFGIINVKNMQTYGRMGEKKKDNCTGVNPCASPDTLVLTKLGHYKIKDLVGRTVDIWDGTQWVTVDNFRVTGYNQSMLKITMQDGSEERVTPYHQMILENGERIEACKLSRGSRLAISNAPIVHGWWTPGDARVQGVFMQELAADTDHLNMSVFSWNIHARLEFLTGIMQKPRGAQSDNDEALHDLQSYSKKWLQYVQSLLKTVGISSVVSPSYGASKWKLTLESAPPIVASVEYDGVEEKVYCCTVPKTHAFSLTSGY